MANQIKTILRINLNYLQSLEEIFMKLKSNLATEYKYQHYLSIIYRQSFSTITFSYFLYKRKSTLKQKQKKKPPTHNYTKNDILIAVICDLHSLYIGNANTND